TRSGVHQATSESHMPAHVRPCGYAPPVECSNSRGNHMARIAIADDDADIRELVVFKLRHGGHDVVPVGDGAAAVEACTAQKPDLVILDVMMPGMSGLDAARAL